MPTNLPDTINQRVSNRFHLPVHPTGAPARSAAFLYHKQGAYVVGWGQGTPEPTGLEYQLEGSAFGWRRIAKGEKPRFIADDPERRTPDRHELGDLDQDLWPAGSDGTPLDPWCRAAQLNLVRVKDGTRLIFEATAWSAVTEVEILVEQIVWLSRDKAAGACPVIVTGTQQVRNARKNQAWWIPTFTISRWNEPDGAVQAPAPEPRPAPSIEAAVEVKPPCERKPRNAYQGLKQEEPSRGATLSEILDDKIPF